VPRYYFHLHNDIEAWDEEGRELPDLDSATAEGMRAARDLVAEGARQGRITLSHWIEIGDDQGARLAAISFGEAVEIQS
jgi:hypothetical protein